MEALAEQRVAIATARAAAALARVVSTAATIADARAAIQDAIAAVRADDLGYNPNRDKGGKFAPGVRKKTDHVERAQGHVARASSRLQAAAARVERAHVDKAKAFLAAKEAIGQAKSRAAAARKDPSAANVDAARKATGAALKARAAVFTHDQQIAQRSAEHAAATTRHALATATLAEAHRRASAPVAPITATRDLHPHGIGFERIHGEHDTGAQPLSETPAFSLASTMGRIHGEGEHATVEHGPVVHTAPPKESALDMLARRKTELYGEGGYRHQAPTPRHQDLSAEALAKHQEAERAARDRIATARAAATPPADARSGGLPSAAVVQRVGLLQRLGDGVKRALRMDDLGYNPYRDKGGKFAPGAHKARPGVVEKAKARVSKAAEKLAGAKAAKKEAVAKAREAIKGAKSAAILARKQPTAKNVKAAQVATNKATRATAKVDKHTIAVAKHTEAHVVAKAKHAEARAAAKGGAPAKAKPAAQHTDEYLAGVVHDTVRKMPASVKEGSAVTGHTAFISDVHARLSATNKAKFGGTLEGFKQKLVELNRGGHVALARADLVDSFSPHKVAASEINSLGSDFHFIRQR